MQKLGDLGQELMLELCPVGVVRSAATYPFRGRPPNIPPPFPHNFFGPEGTLKLKKDVTREGLHNYDHNNTATTL